jgi:adenine deaminase
MTSLSPAAQSVLDAAMQYEINPECYSREIAAAALRAAADQVVPACQSIDRADGSLRQGDILWDDATASICRRKLLAIAAELEQS